MRNNRLVRLTESDLHRIVEKTVGKMLREDANSDIIDKWYDIRDTLGDETIADAIVGFLGYNNLQTFMRHLETNWGLNDYTDDELE